MADVIKDLSEAKKASNENYDNYRVIINKKKDKFVLFIAELGIVEADTSLEKAYNKVEAEVKRYIQKMNECGLEDEIITSKTISSRTGKNGLFAFLQENIAAFIVKLLIVCFTIAIALSFVADKIENFMAVRAEAIMSRIESNISNRIADLNVEEFLKVKAEDLYNKINNMPQEKIEEKRLKLKTVIRKIKPLMDELRSVNDREDEVKEENGAGNAY